jgi:prepilin-type N-terminal cleavage/methylation domain-containing protein
MEGAVMSRRQRCGFTLLELLIASTIFVVIMLAVYTAFRTGIVSYRKIEGSLGTYQTGRLILTRLESDLKNSFAYTSQDTGFAGNTQAIDFFSIVDTFERDGKSYADVCRVHYWFADGLLQRSLARGLNAYKRTLDSSAAQELSSDIQSIEFRYAYPVNRAASDYDWQTVWPKNDEQKKNFPLVVQITLTIREPLRGTAKPKIATLTKVVALPLSRL